MTADVAEARPPTRSAAHWFLDAATYACDGEFDLAIEAALTGIAALSESAVADA